MKDPAAVHLGTKGGKARSPRKARAARKNGRHGGRPKVGDEKEMECPRCHKMSVCSYGPDPYKSEINNDPTPSWQCENCSSESADYI